VSLASTILRAPADERSRREVAYLALTLLPAVPAFMLALFGLAAIVVSVLGVGLPLLAAALALARLSGALFRVPAKVTLGWTWPAPAPLTSRRLPRRVAELLRNGEAWRSLLYCGAKLPVTALGLYGAVVGYVVGVAGATYPAWWFVAHGALGLFGDRPWTHT
jgi:hypothetical protein